MRSQGPTRSHEARVARAFAHEAAAPSDHLAKARLKDRIFGGCSTQRIGRFRVLDEIGRGGMGVVYLGHDDELQRHVAIKVLHTPGPHDKQRLRREARALARLSHPNVVSVHELGEHEGRFFVAMEYVRGQTLRQWQSGEEASTEHIVARYLAAGEGLDAAHRAGLVHRDFKPDNVLVAEDGRVRVVDFGLVFETEALSTLIDASGPASDDATSLGTTLTRTGALVGTPAYIAPEQYSGHCATPVSDQFSFCVALHEALFGQRPFQGTTLSALRAEVLAGRIQATPPSRTVSSGLRATVLRGLETDPEARYPSMSVLLNALRQAQARPRRRLLLGGIAVLVAVSGSWAVASERDRPTCHADAREFEHRWREVSSRVGPALEAAQAAPAPDAAPVVRHLQDYAERWLERHQAICESSSARASRSGDPRLQCLDERRRSFTAVLGVFLDADRATASRARELVYALPSPSSCTDPNLSRPPPPPPSVAAEVSEIEERLARVDALDRAGRYAEALESVDALMADVRDVPYPPILVSALNAAARGRLRIGRFEEALGMAREAYVISDRAPIPVAVDNLEILGGILTRLARYEEAGLELRKGLSILERHPSSDRLQAASLRNTLGIVLEDQGELDVALESYRDALSIRIAQRGERHPDVAASRLNLAQVLMKLGKATQALEQLRTALDVQLETLGPRHPHIGATKDAMGRAYNAMGEYEAARSEFEAARVLRSETYGEQHPLVAASHNNLASADFSLGRYEDALAGFERALEIRVASLGPKHPEVAASHNNVSYTLRLLGRYDEALEHLDAAYEIHRRSTGERHPIVAQILHNRGDILYAMGQFETALDALKQARRLRIQLFDPRHPAVSSEHYSFGLVLLELGRLEESLKEFRAARDAWSAPSAPPRAAALTDHRIGDVLDSMGQPTAALEAYRSAHDVLSREGAGAPAELSQVLAGIALSELRLGHRQRALEARRALERRAAQPDADSATLALANLLPILFEDMADRSRTELEAFLGHDGVWHWVRVSRRFARERAKG